MSTPPAVATKAVGKRYRHKWALEDCTLEIPAGRIAALVGPNGSGKSTLLRMAAGITRQTCGDVSVFGQSPEAQAASVLARIGYLDQERPLYRSFRVREMLRFGSALNPNWDEDLALGHLSDLHIDLAARVGHLSVGQRAQVALTLCLAKRPELLLLDEPVAALDPLARADVMQMLLAAVAETGATVVLSSHAISDLAAVCDYLIVLSAGRVTLADDLDYVLASHRLLIGPHSASPPAEAQIVSSMSSARQTHVLAKLSEPIDCRDWQVVEPSLEEIVLAYLRASRGADGEPADISSATLSHSQEISR